MRIGPYEEPQVRFLSAVYTLDRPLLEQSWKTRWERSSKGRHLFHLIPEPTRAVRKLHAGVSKAYSSLIVQLRTGTVGFNASLHERRVPGVISPRCDCDFGTMSQ